MKKKIIFFNLVLSLFISGCSNANVNNVMNTISSSIETGITNVSDFINKLATSKPLNVFPAVPQSKYFEIDSYKLNIKYTDNLGIEIHPQGFFLNKTDTSLTLIIDFPIYDLYGKIVDKGVIQNTFNSGRIDNLWGSYYQYGLKKDLRIVQEQVRTRVYMNGKLIASAGMNQSSAVKNTTTKPKQQTVKQETKKETPVINSASPKPRQTRQSVKK